MSEGRLRDNEDLESRRLRSVKYCLFVPKQWVGKVKRNQPCDAIFEIPFASLDGDGELRRLLNEWALRDRGERLNPDLECTSQTQIATAIEHGACCGILPDFFESSFDRKDVTVFRSSKLDDLKRTLHLAWFPGNPRRSLNPIRAKAIQSIAGAFGS
jgi:DNA-binding transcriptional LysR family regulator